MAGACWAAARLKPSSMDDPILKAIVVVTLVALLLLAIGAIPLLVWYRRRFREALAMSQRQADGQDR